eukprot:6466390-Amphidinium_carterae.1
MLLGSLLRWRIPCPCAQCGLTMRLIVGPENKATALLISHRQRADACKKPGTAFTTEYQIPGTDVRTLVQKHSILLLNNETWNVLSTDHSVMDLA